MKLRHVLSFPVLATLAGPSCGDPSDPPAAPASLFASPDAIELARAGDVADLDVRIRDDGGVVRSVTDFTATTGDPAVVTVAGATLRAEGPGVTTVAVSAGGRTTSVDVRVGPDLAVLTGLTPAFHGIASAHAAAAPLPALPTGASPARVRVVDGRGYAVFSGDFFGGSGARSALLVFDPATLTPIAWHDDLGALGAQDIAVVAPDRAFLVGIENGVRPIDPTTGVMGDPLDLGGLARDGVTIGLQSGSAAVVHGHLLFIANSGTHPDFTWDERASLFIYDLAAATFRDPIILASGCKNSGALFLADDALIVGCTGDYGATPSAVEVIDLPTLASRGLTPFANGTAGSFAFDAPSGRVLAGSAFGHGVGAIDVVRGAVVADLASPVALDATDAPNSFTSVAADGAGRAYALAFGTDEVFTFDPQALPAGAPLARWLDLSPDPGAAAHGAQHLVATRLRRPPLHLTPENAVIEHPAPGGAFADPASLYGPPHGGGALVPNVSQDDLLTIPEGGAVTVHLRGVALTDGPGIDLVVFENAFLAAGDHFARAIEPATVQLSEDGLTWIDYPTQEDPAFPRGALSSDSRRFRGGFVGVEPVHANPDVNAVDLAGAAAGGDRFDLAAVGLRSARAIRIVDVPGDGATADLDAVVLAHWRHD